jgi:hypothetical protein
MGTSSKESQLLLAIQAIDKDTDFVVTGEMSCCIELLYSLSVAGTLPSLYAVASVGLYSLT